MPARPVIAPVIALVATLAVAALAPAPAAAQTAVPFGDLAQDTGAPVELSADRLTVEEGGTRAVMEGSVVVGQGELRLAADRVEVDYLEGRIARLLATGSVVLTQGEDAAEAAEADYDIDRGTVILTGDVLVTQGPTAVAAERATVDLTTGSAVMEGRVRTVLGGE